MVSCTMTISVSSLEDLHATLLLTELHMFGQFFFTPQLGHVGPFQTTLVCFHYIRHWSNIHYDTKIPRAFGNSMWPSLWQMACYSPHLLTLCLKALWVADIECESTIGIYSSLYKLWSSMSQSIGQMLWHATGKPMRGGHIRMASIYKCSLKCLNCANISELRKSACQTLWFLWRDTETCPLRFLYVYADLRS